MTGATVEVYPFFLAFFVQMDGAPLAPNRRKQFIFFPHDYRRVCIYRPSDFYPVHNKQGCFRFFLQKMSFFGRNLELPK